MKKVSLAVLLSLSAVATGAFAQSDQGVTMSTDPAKISDVESRAQALQSRQETQQMTEQAPAHKSMHHKKSHSKPAAGSSQ
ncbi:hypothetical protein AWB77_06615 [Caballeronia fortuita]|uniref:Uncharacterized protein n=1 Tax=Caballeronia fortuita TaxID=1777138 RepID=A0A158E7J9_9BURK|nr:hypothetical protein [Caballeronia fortuita]SAL02743.1 hypothetical protein AWB77_06615 [Caballeronia fortuita]